MNLQPTVDTPHKRSPATLSVRWAALPVGFAAAFAVGALVALVVRTLGWWPGAAWEQAALHAAQRTVSAPLDVIMLTLPLIGTNYSLAPVVAVVAYVLWRKHYTAVALHLVIAQIGSWVLNPALKFSFPRDRPTLYEQRGQHAFPAFPSGHSIAVVSVMLTAAYLLYRYRRSTWGFWVVGVYFLLNAYSRIYLSVHWPTDVIGGTLVGATWFLACRYAFDKAHSASR